MKAAICLILAVSISAVIACDKRSGENETSAKPEPATVSSTPAASQPTAGAHAPDGVKPGSYEDWCDEHQVPESMCTRCNPTLIAAFKATGDWCDEHGLPESQCLLCNPDLKIVRPAKTEEPKSNG